MLLLLRLAKGASGFKLWLLLVASTAGGGFAVVVVSVVFVSVAY